MISFKFVVGIVGIDCVLPLGLFSNVSMSFADQSPLSIGKARSNVGLGDARNALYFRSTQ